MRRDARKLLEKLNRNDFSYKMFDDSFSETELWPIFEAVLRDSAIVGEIPVAVSSSQGGLAATDGLTQPVTTEAPTVSNHIFGQYGAPGRPRAKDVDLGTFFKRFSEKD
ncbi:hypothetical protein [Sphingobium sp.]|uniref:hypothetical protein n=1 Tax=Sphingobium sp. TaxID=1912891 RepID=UPI002BBBD323|nr:hypothetical protein [Sphingobium sp.]HUD91113.1 hypothetical protein [Sphingobium sp.]